MMYDQNHNRAARMVAEDHIREVCKEMQINFETIQSQSYKLRIEVKHRCAQRRHTDWVCNNNSCNRQDAAEKFDRKVRYETIEYLFPVESWKP